jgi:hypothetical protein
LELANITKTIISILFINTLLRNLREQRPSQGASFILDYLSLHFRHLRVYSTLFLHPILLKTPLGVESLGRWTKTLPAYSKDWGAVDRQRLLQKKHPDPLRPTTGDESRNLAFEGPNRPSEINYLNLLTSEVGTLKKLMTVSAFWSDPHHHFWLRHSSISKLEMSILPRTLDPFLS